MFNPEQNTTADTPPEKAHRKSGAYFRIAYYTHLNLSKQADHKAHLMLGLNTLVLSVVISKHHAGALMKMHHLWVPNLMLVAMCLTVAIFAILASRPLLPRRPAEQQPNWLFFGSFAAFPYSAFQENIARLIQDEDALQEAMSRDLLLLGKAVARKYLYLSYCYRVFGIGLPSVTLLYLCFWFAN